MYHVVKGANGENCIPEITWLDVGNTHNINRHKHHKLKRHQHDHVHDVLLL